MHVFKSREARVSTGVELFPIGQELFGGELFVSKSWSCDRIRAVGERVILRAGRGFASLKPVRVVRSAKKPSERSSEVLGRFVATGRLSRRCLHLTYGPCRVLSSAELYHGVGALFVLFVNHRLDEVSFITLIEIVFKLLEFV